MGKNCSQPYDACSFKPCQNGATCSSVLGSHDYNCSCKTGFTDVNCSTNIDDCVSAPCQLPLVCYDRINGYNCSCPKGLYIHTDCNFSSVFTGCRAVALWEIPNMKYVAAALLYKWCLVCTWFISSKIWDNLSWCTIWLNHDIVCLTCMLKDKLRSQP